MHHPFKLSINAGPVGAALGRCSGYRPYSACPFNSRRTCRSISANFIRTALRRNNVLGPDPREVHDEASGSAISANENSARGCNRSYDIERLLLAS